MVTLYSALTGYNLHSNLIYAKEYKDSEVDTKSSASVKPGLIANKIAAERIFVRGILFVPLALIFLCFGFIFAILGGSGSGIGYKLPGMVLTVIVN